MSRTIAVPSANPGGLDSPLGEHFGHCDLYTLVTADNGKISGVEVVPNVPHQQGGCMAPVQHLADIGVHQLIAGGMGLRPLTGFNRMGIKVYYGCGAQTVGEAVQAMLAGELPEFKQERTCTCGGH